MRFPRPLPGVERCWPRVMGSQEERSRRKRPRPLACRSRPQAPARAGAIAPFSAFQSHNARRLREPLHTSMGVLSTGSEYGSHKQPTDPGGPHHERIQDARRNDGGWCNRHRRRGSRISGATAATSSTTNAAATTTPSTTTTTPTTPTTPAPSQNSGRPKGRPEKSRARTWAPAPPEAPAPALNQDPTRVPATRAFRPAQATNSPERCGTPGHRGRQRRSRVGRVCWRRLVAGPYRLGGEEFPILLPASDLELSHARSAGAS